MNGKHRTEAQLAALREAYKVLEAQFDSFLIVCASRGDIETHGTDPDVLWKGGFMLAAGLTHHALERIKFARSPAYKPK
jgi:hypothetical protein